MRHPVNFTVSNDLVFDQQASSLTMTAKRFLWVDQVLTLCGCRETIGENGR
jgi:hypothetical protein